MSQRSFETESSALFENGFLLDPHGRPLVVYHGTNQDFDLFDMAKASDGAHFFSEDPIHAEHFGKVSSYLLTMVNPLVISQDDLEAEWDLDHPSGEHDDRNMLPRDYVDLFVERARDAGHDGLTILRMGDLDLEVNVHLPLSAEQILRIPDPRLARDAPALGEPSCGHCGVAILAALRAGDNYLAKKTAMDAIGLARAKGGSPEELQSAILHLRTHARPGVQAWPFRKVIDLLTGEVRKHAQADSAKRLNQNSVSAPQEELGL